MDLKPCPFCGGEAIFIDTSIASGYIVCIGDCGIKTEKFWDSIHESGESNLEVDWKQKAAKIWNRRI